MHPASLYPQNLNIRSLHNSTVLISFSHSSFQSSNTKTSEVILHLFLHLCQSSPFFPTPWFNTLSSPSQYHQYLPWKFYNLKQHMSDVMTKMVTNGLNIRLLVCLLHPSFPNLGLNNFLLLYVYSNYLVFILR